MVILIDYVTKFMPNNSVVICMPAKVVQRIINGQEKND